MKAANPSMLSASGALIWNYLQRELLREKNRGESSETWVMRCAIACVYILPCVAFRMEREHRMTLTLEQVVALTKEAIERFNPFALPKYLQAISDKHYDSHYRRPNSADQLEDMLHTVIRDTGILLRGKSDDTRGFVHQHFRDALAGLYLVYQAEMMRDGEELPEMWRRAANYEVMGYAAEMMEEQEAQRLWEANRVKKPMDKSATYAMMELQMWRWNRKHLGLNFSGMDLHGMSLVRYMRGKQHGERDMKLFRHSELSVQTQLDEETFRSPGHT